MKGWRLVVLFCTALLCEPVRPQDKWSRPETAEKRVDDWIPITASCPSCQKNLEPNEASGVDEIGSLLNPPAVPSGRAFNFNTKQNNFNRAPTGEPYEATTPPAPSAQFFSQQQVSKIQQPVHFSVPFFGQQNPFQTRFQGLPSFQPQFTFIPQQQIQPAPKENKVMFPESPFIQQQNKGSVQLVYVPIEALQRQKPRLQADRPIPQQTQLQDVKTPSPFETGKLKFQRPPQQFDSSRFPSNQQFEQESNRFAPLPTSFVPDTSHFPPPSQFFEQPKPTFQNQLKEQRPEFLPQNEQPVAPQSYQFVEDARNPPSNIFQFHENRFQKPSFEKEKPKELKPQVQQNFVPNFDGSRQESTQSFVSNFDGRQGPPQRQGPSQKQGPPQNFQETRLRPEQPPQNFQETRPRQEQRPPQFIPKFEEPKLEPQPQFIPNFQETRPRQEPPPPQFVPKFEEPKLEPQPQFIPNFQETRPRQEPPPPPFVPKFEEPKLEPQQQFIPNFQETRPRQETPPPQFVPKLEEPKLEPQQQFIPNFQEIPQQEAAQQTFPPNFESLRPKSEVPQNFHSQFQETRPKQESQESFVHNFEEIKTISKPTTQQTSTSQQAFNLPSSTEQIIQTSSTPYPPPHQPPLSVYMEKRLDNKINEVLTILKDAKTIPVLDTIGNRAPKVFVGPSDLDSPRGYIKFQLPYLSSLDITKIDSMADSLPFFVAPLNFKPPLGYAKIPFPPPHIGSVVVSSRSPAVVSSTEFIPFTLTSELPTEVNSLQPSVSSTTHRGTERAQYTTDVTPTTTKRSRSRKPLHRGSLTSFSTSTPLNDITERQRDQFTTPAELQKLSENSASVSEQQQFVESTPSIPSRQKFSRKPVEQQIILETTQAPNKQQHFIESTPTPIRQKFSRKPVEQQTEFETTQTPIQQQQFDSSPQQQFFADQQVPQTQQNYLDTLPQLTQSQFFDHHHQQQQQQPTQQSIFENHSQPSQQSFLENHSQPSQQSFLENQQRPSQQSFLENQQQPSQQTLFANQQQQSQQTFLEDQQQPSQQTFFENQQQFLDHSQQNVQDTILNNPQSLTDISNTEANQQQFVSSSTEKQVFKNFQQVQPLSQYQVGNNYLHQQQSSTEQVQLASSSPQTVSDEPQTVVTIAPTDTPKLRQRLSYYDKLSSSSTQTPVEITSTQNTIESSEKPRERPKLRPRQRLTTTRRPITESTPTSEEVSEQVSETSTQRYNPLKRRRPTTTTTSTTTEQTETTRNPLRSRTTQAGRSEFVRSRSRRPTTTTTTTTTSTTTTEAAPVPHYEDATNDVQTPGGGHDEQRKIEEAASFWNEPVTIQQSHSYELDTRYTQPPSTSLDFKYSSAEPPVQEEDFSKEKYGNEKKAHDPNGEKKARKGHWVRVRVKKPQDSLDTAESQNSLGPLSANAIQEAVTKPTTEFNGSPSAAVESVTTSTTTESTTSMPTTTSTTTTTTTASPPVMTTVLVDYTEYVTEEHPAETTVVPPSLLSSPASTAVKYPDDEQDEAFQRNLADMLAKFISGGNNEPQQQEKQQKQEQQQQEQQQEQEEETTATATEETIAETQYAGSDDAELIVTSAVVTELPVAPVTSTTTKVSMETEICYRGRCVKSKKNKQITDLVTEP